MSHNKMSTFFSTTDMSELEDNAPNHNYYLSLIVNNAFEPTAKIAFIGKQSTQSISKRSFINNKGETYEYEIKDEVEEEVLFIYNCIIEYPDNIKVNATFKQRTEAIIKEREDRISRAKIAQQNKKKSAGVQIRGQQAGSEDLFDFGNGILMSAAQIEAAFETGSSFEDFVDQDQEDLEDEAVNFVIEKILADTLMEEYDSKENLDEALFKGNITFKKEGDDYIARVGNFFRGMVPMYFTEKYIDETTLDLKESVLQKVIEVLYFNGEQNFEELVNQLVEEIAN